MTGRGSNVFLHQTLIYYRSEFARVRYTRLSDSFQEPAMYCEVPRTLSVLSDWLKICFILLQGALWPRSASLTCNYPPNCFDR